MPVSKLLEDDTHERLSIGPDTGPLCADTGPVRGETAEERHGGFSLAGALFGWLVAVAMTVMLAGILGAGIVGAGIARVDADGVGVTLNVSQSQTWIAEVASFIAVFVILMIAHLCGGYVAGRMSRFDGGRQGRDVCRLSLAVTILAVGMLGGAWFGTQSDVLERALPTVAAHSITVIAGWVVTLLGVVLGTRISAVSGGRVGQRYQAKIDRAVT